MCKNDRDLKNENKNSEDGTIQVSSAEYDEQVFESGLPATKGPKESRKHSPLLQQIKTDVRKLYRKDQDFAKTPSKKDTI